MKPPLRANAHNESPKLMRGTFELIMEASEKEDRNLTSKGELPEGWDKDF